MSLQKKRNLPIQIFRLSGIYSNQYNILTRLKSGEAKIINKKNHFFSRIHVEDIANVLFSSLNSFKKKEIYNIELSAGKYDKNYLDSLKLLKRNKKIKLLF